MDVQKRKKKEEAVAVSESDGQLRSDDGDPTECEEMWRIESKEKRETEGGGR